MLPPGAGRKAAVFVSAEGGEGTVGLGRVRTGLLPFDVPGRGVGTLAPIKRP